MSEGIRFQSCSLAYQRSMTSFVSRLASFVSRLASFVSRLASRRPGNIQNASQGWVCRDDLTWWHTEIASDQPCCLTQPQGTDTGPTIPSTDPMTHSVFRPTSFKSLLRLGCDLNRRLLSLGQRRNHWMCDGILAPKENNSLFHF